MTTATLNISDSLFTGGICHLAGFMYHNISHSVFIHNVVFFWFFFWFWRGGVVVVVGGGWGVGGGRRKV